MKANKKTLTLLGAGMILTLISGGVYMFLFLATNNKAEATSLLLEKIDELSGRESRIASSVLVLRHEDANIKKISETFFKESEVVVFTKKIEALGEQSGTTLKIESLEQGFTEKTVPFLSFRIMAIGKFSDIQRLLILIENFPGRFDWKTVRLVRDSEVVSGRPQWRVDVFLTALNFTN